MIKFFRNIRKRLLSDPPESAISVRAGSKFSKYLLYAIGEIILVVIGILIALQINNWNQNRIAKQQELAYLREIKTNLDKDLIRIEKVLQFNKEKDSVIERGFEIMANEEDTTKKLIDFSQLFNILTVYEVFEPVRIAFDNMTSAADINLVSNSKLRTQLSEYYGTENYTDGTQERIKEQTRLLVDEVVPLVVTDEMAKMLTGHDFEFSTAEKNEFYKNASVFNHLFTMKMVGKSQNELVLNAKERAINLQKIIQQILTDAYN